MEPGGHPKHSPDEALKSRVVLVERALMQPLLPTLSRIHKRDLRILVTRLIRRSVRWQRPHASHMHRNCEPLERVLQQLDEQSNDSLDLRRHCLYRWDEWSGVLDESSRQVTIAKVGGTHCACATGR